MNLLSDGVCIQNNSRYFGLLCKIFLYSYFPVYFLILLLVLVSLLVAPEIIESEGAGISNYDYYFSFMLFGVISPILETLMLVLIVVLGQKITDNHVFNALFVALFFGLMHVYVSVIYGLVQFWPFLLQGYLFSIKRSVKTATAIIGAHMINNILMISLYWWAESL